MNKFVAAERLIMFFIKTSPEYPGTPLMNGSYGSEVARVQTYLNALSKVEYPSLGTITVDGRFGYNTEKTVTLYQTLTNLTPDGIVGKDTWNTLIDNYNSKIGGSADTYPGISLSNGMTGQDVTHMQSYLDVLAKNPYTAIITISEDGIFGDSTQNSTILMQTQFALKNDGIIGENTWNKIVQLQSRTEHVITPYPGYYISLGASGNEVRFVQSYCNSNRGINLTIDGEFGQDTKNAVIAIQEKNNLKADGIVGNLTWSVLVKEFNENL